MNRFLSRIIILILLLVLYRAGLSQSIDQYLHKNALLKDGPSSKLPGFTHKPISSKEAVSFAVDHLKAKGVTNIVVCEVRWIAAPLGGYLIDSKGKTVIKGKLYTTFRVGIRDGSEEKDGRSFAGEMFVFIAMGRDKSGHLYWYPPPGPDIRPQRNEADSSVLDYEFLIHRDRFQSLDKMYK